MEGRPVVVLSNNDGCIIARSDEAKALGFAMGDPYHLTLHGIQVFSSNYALYNHLAKVQPDTGGVYDLTEIDVDHTLASLEVGEVWGVGPRWAAWLEAQGITTALDLKQADPR